MADDQISVQIAEKDEFKEKKRERKLREKYLKREEACNCNEKAIELKVEQDKLQREKEKTKRIMKEVTDLKQQI